MIRVLCMFLGAILGLLCAAILVFLLDGPHKWPWEKDA